MVDDDIIDGFRAMQEAGQAKRAENRERSAKRLTDHDIQFESKNGGAHLVVDGGDRGWIDFWPGTGLWMARKTQTRRRGVERLIEFITVPF